MDVLLQFVVVTTALWMSVVVWAAIARTIVMAGASDVAAVYAAFPATGAFVVAVINIWRWAGF